MLELNLLNPLLSFEQLLRQFQHELISYDSILHLVNLIVVKYKSGKLIYPIDFAKTIVQVGDRSIEDAVFNTHLDLDGSSMESIFADVNLLNSSGIHTFGAFPPPGFNRITSKSRIAIR